MQHGKIFTLLFLFLVKSWSFEINDYKKDGIYFYPNNNNPESVIITHTSKNTSNIKRLNRSKARLEAINIFINYANKDTLKKEDLTYEENHVEKIRSKIVLKGVEVKKTIVNKDITKIILNIPYENIIKKKKTIKETKEEIFNNLGFYNEVPYVFYAFEISNKDNFKKAFNDLISYFDDKNYVAFSSFLQNILNENVVHKLLSSELTSQKSKNALDKRKLFESIKMYNNINSNKQLKIIADILYKKDLKKLSLLIYMHLYVFTNDNKEDIKNRLKSADPLDFKPFTKIIKMILTNNQADKKLSQWIKSEGYLVTLSILNSYGNLTLNEKSSNYITNIYESNKLNDKALFLLRNKKYQEASSLFMKKLEINPFDKLAISYLGYCLERMGYQNSSNILYFQSFSFDYIENKYTKRIK